MRTIKRSLSFKKDFKKIKATPKHAKDIDVILRGVIKLLLLDQELPDKNRDHNLTGNWIGYKECHIKPDLLLIYKNSDDNMLRLARIGSHSELFG
ncbi:MAG: type II toxin-antitoxin system YafQ family toxin [Thiotrichales bacterium]|jgi:mRNA interferase YafQ|nr:type II toxin-antitoxin system YafQ family toxin [Thiotrichales bacterium]MBT5291372.1 type II toxin-antitoxin system YafQ family toxin [Thiotrichales bacterium]MBT7314686.1 type II toxin-antitoxin system YafQ family toxin [Thiotrichales bacterium]